MTENSEKRENRWKGEALSALEANPRWTLLAMAAILAASIIGTVLYAVLKKPIAPESAEQETNAPMGGMLDGMSDGMGKLINSGAAIVEALSLKRDIAHLMDKDELTEADSIDLIRALRKLDALQQQPNTKTR